MIEIEFEKIQVDKIKKGGAKSTCTNSTHLSLATVHYVVCVEGGG